MQLSNKQMYPTNAFFVTKRYVKSVSKKLNYFRSIDKNRTKKSLWEKLSEHVAHLNGALSIMANVFVSKFTVNYIDRTQNENFAL